MTAGPNVSAASDLMGLRDTARRSWIGYIARMSRSTPQLAAWEARKTLQRLTLGQTLRCLRRCAVVAASSETLRDAICVRDARGQQL
jgi:hypothetical protein